MSASRIDPLCEFLFLGTSYEGPQEAPSTPVKYLLGNPHAEKRSWHGGNFYTVNLDAPKTSHAHLFSMKIGNILGLYRVILG